MSEKTELEMLEQSWSSRYSKWVRVNGQCGLSLCAVPSHSFFVLIWQRVRDKAVQVG